MSEQTRRLIIALELSAKPTIAEGAIESALAASRAADAQERIAAVLEGAQLHGGTIKVQDMSR